MVIKKVIVNRDQLPPITEDGKFYFRFRVVSEDKSLTSTWSNVLSVVGPTILQLTGKAETPVPNIYAINGSGMSVSWSYDQDLNDSRFDVFVKWAYDGPVKGTDDDVDNEFTYDESWIYFGTVTGTTAHITIPYSGSVIATHLKARIQIETTNKKVSNDTYVLVSESITGVSTTPKMDGGSVKPMLLA